MSKEKDATIGSDLEYLDALRDEDIDYEDAPAPDLAAWVRDAKPFSVPGELSDASEAHKSVD